MPRWGLLSDLILKLYNRLSISEKLKSPMTDLELISKIRAYVDDTNYLMISNDVNNLVKLLIHNATTWE
jgi:hypothetical protein